MNQQVPEAAQEVTEKRVATAVGSNENTDTANDEPHASELSLRSILALAASALAYFVTVGFMNAYGVFQTSYTLRYLQGYSQFQISWIGSFASFTLFAFAAPAGFLADRVGPTIPICIGVVLQLVAVFMISLCHEYYQFFLAQGVLLGIGMSFVAIPTVTIVPLYFKRHRGLAQGVSIAGSSLGGVLWPITLDQLLNHDGISFGWSLRIVGFIMLPLLVLVILFLRKPVVASSKAKDTEAAPEEKPKQKKDMSCLKQPAFIFLCIGLGLAYFGFFSPLFYISTYAVSQGVSESMAFYLLSMLNGASLFGRILPGFIADRLGPFNVLTISCFGSALVVFCWTTATSLPGLIVWSLAYGFISGAIMSLQLATATSLVPAEMHGLAMGSAMASVSLTALFGTPAAGQIVERSGYIGLSCFSGAMLLAGGVSIGMARFARDKRLLAKV